MNNIQSKYYRSGVTGVNYLIINRSVYTHSELLPNNTTRVIKCNINDKEMNVHEKKKNDEEWATITSNTVCTSESTLLCAVIMAKRKLSSIHVGSSVISEIAVAIENPNALCPLGIPPLRGVPTKKIAFTIIVAMHTITSTINIV